MHRSSIQIALGLLTLIVLFSCRMAEDDEKVVSIKGVPLYRVPSGGRVVKGDELNEADVQLYNRLFNHHPLINQPVYRIVKASGFTVYLGLVLDEEMKGRLPELFAGDSAWTVKDVRAIGKNGKLAFLRNDSLYNVRLVGHYKKTKLTHLVNLKTRDSALAASYYYADSLFRGDFLL